MADIITLPFKYIVGDNGLQYNDDIVDIKRTNSSISLIEGVDWTADSTATARDVSDTIELITHNIVGGDETTEQFVIVGDWTAKFINDVLIYVSDTIVTNVSVENGGNPYTVLSSEYDSLLNQTTITVSGDIIAGGAITDGIIRTIPIGATLDIKQKDYVYFTRSSIIDMWEHVNKTDVVMESFATQTYEMGSNIGDTYKREHGRDNLNFLWMHRTPRAHLIDPSTTNIHDIFIIPKGYFSSVKEWLDGSTTKKPAEPTPQELRSSYGHLLNNKMLSDTIVLHPGRFKILFGSYANIELRAKFKVIRSPNRTLTDNQIKVQIVSAIKNFFNIEMWEFGESFYFTELSSYIHNELPTEIDSVVLVPIHSTNFFGDIFEVQLREDEIFQPHINVSDIEIVDSYNRLNIRQVDE